MKVASLYRLMWCRCSLCCNDRGEILEQQQTQVSDVTFQNEKKQLNKEEKKIHIINKQIIIIIKKITILKFIKKKDSKTCKKETQKFNNKIK